VKKLTPILFFFFLLASLQASAFEIALNKHALTSPVLDAKAAYSRGNKNLVGIKVAEDVLLPGIKPERQASIRKQYRIRILNRHRRALKNTEENSSDKDIRELYKLKRYANRYNLTIMKLIKAEKLEQQGRYRY
jgi:hypothetical protein